MLVDLNRLDDTLIVMKGFDTDKDMVNNAREEMRLIRKENELAWGLYHMLENAMTLRYRQGKKHNEATHLAYLKVRSACVTMMAERYNGVMCPESMKIAKIFVKGCEHYAKALHKLDD